jgi:hypothetical protein
MSYPSWKITSCLTTQGYQQDFIEPEGSLLCSQDPSTGPRRYPDESYFPKAKFNIIIPTGYSPYKFRNMCMFHTEPSTRSVNSRGHPKKTTQTAPKCREKTEIPYSNFRNKLFVLLIFENPSGYPKALRRHRNASGYRLNVDNINMATSQHR